jgi:pentose-5-phosphate-3-epimerase
MRGSVTLTCDNPDMHFLENKTAHYTILEQADEVQTYIMRRTLIINDVDYTFTDYETAKGSEIIYNVTGTMTMERKLNTQMPEEDQIVF